MSVFDVRLFVEEKRFRSERSCLLEQTNFLKPTWPFVDKPPAIATTSTSYAHFWHIHCPTPAQSFEEFEAHGNLAYA